MLKYSDQAHHPSEVVQQSTEKFDGVSLAKLWEYVIRTNSLPEDIKLPQILTLIQEKLRNPEWEVRQHALRVLSDIIPLVNPDTIDENMEMLLGDLVTNLGHIAPAVRKGAVDSLRIYLKHSNKSDNFLRNLIERGVKMPQENNVHPNIVAGIILGVPFLIVTKMNEDTVFYAVQSLLDEITKITRRDIALRSLFRIKELVGSGKFNQYLNGYKNDDVKRDFNVLYDTHYNLLKSNVNREIDTYWGDFSQNSDEKEYVVGIPDDGKVILETEIQLNSGSAIKMQIHEESRQSSFLETDSDEESRNGIGIIKILTTDDSEKEDHATQRRTPRRVHFGGEVVKMRTPDSDSNNTSEENTIVKKITLKRSLIPVPIKERTKTKTEKRTIRSSSISVEEMHVFGTLINCTSSRIPTRRGGSLKKTKKTTRVAPDIKIISPSIELPEKQPATKKGDDETHKSNLGVVSTKNTLKSDRFSPIPVHHEIEVLHNLMRSPSRNVEKIKANEKILEQTKQNDDANKQKTTEVALNDETKTKIGKFEENKPPINKLEEKNRQQTGEFGENKSTINETRENRSTISETRENKPLKGKTEENKPSPEELGDDKRLSTADDALLPKKPTRTAGHQRKIQTADEVFLSPRHKNDGGSTKTTYDSFRVYDLKPPPNLDRRQTTDFDVCHEGIIYDLNCKGHLRTRLHGLEYFLQQITARPSILEVIEERLPFVINALFSSTQQALLKNMAEKSLVFLFEHLKREVLLNRLNQISIALSKLGEPDGVRLSIALMRRITPMQLTKQLISESILGAKSSKIREGALQIIMAVSILYPSTDINITETARSVLRVLRDRKRRVRQAALETLASLAQASSADTIMGIARKIFNCTQDGKLLLALLRTRLSKKQLPSVGVSGSIVYSESTDDFYRSRDEYDSGRIHHHYNSEGNISHLGDRGLHANYWKHEHDKINNNWIRDSGQHYFKRKSDRDWSRTVLTSEVSF